MEEIIEGFLTKDSLLSIFTVIFTVIYAVTASFLLKRIKARRIERKDDFFETAVQGLQDGTIETIDDLINVYKGVTKLSSEDLTYRYGLNKWLREILAKLVGRKISENLNIEEVKQLKIKLTEFITANETASPFSDLPDTERNILNDLKTYSNNGDKISIERKISELSSVIQTRYEEQKKLETQNKWSIPLAVIGLILTVVFGILSIF
ncbi:hypothetical protein PZB74_18725 [Porifericola rhodea]|uniref:hypothetical protein n=1 Tax=Porifericola rhodea TaxID=930972 RepID=UPI002666DCB4|nr:hypothetical protein [Porifericola rhodea]WKN30989.1 hypothetical protein PZB74_18725 [Porifericola rhodea]